MKHIFFLLQLFFISIKEEAFSFQEGHHHDHHHGEKFKFPIPIPITTVEVTNLLQNGLSFTIHCKSRDDDLGVHVVESNGQYHWKFHSNYLGTTLFFCGITWNNGSIVYDLYRYNRDYRRCSTHCDWIVTNEFFIGFTQKPRQQDITISWFNNNINIVNLVRK
ncbi:hypothetical protein AHAS_Ahas12G0028200 [Arachis hypogaea]